MYRTEHGTICLKNEPESFREFFEEIGPFPKDFCYAVVPCQAETVRGMYGVSSGDHGKDCSLRTCSDTGAEGSS